jgi:gamma-polyglutamate biosynthesis protein CapA
VIFKGKRWAAKILAALFLLLVIVPEPRIIQITFLGDVMLGRGIAQAANRSKDWQPFVALQPVLQSSDITAANLESPLSDAPVVTIGYALCAPPVQVEALTKARIGLITLANNHVLDCGVIGLDQTKSTLHSNGVLFTGPELEPVYVNLHGQRIAFLALDDISTAIDISEVNPVLQSAAAQSDRVIVSIHWGSEYQPAPSSRQKQLASELVNAGADVIVGHHPHVIQPVEEIIRKKDQTKGLVFYSLGNAIFDQNGLSTTRTGAIVSLFFGPGGSMQFSEQHFEINPRIGIISRFIP